MKTAIYEYYEEIVETGNIEAINDSIDFLEMAKNRHGALSQSDEEILSMLKSARPNDVFKKLRSNIKAIKNEFRSRK